MLNNMNQMMLHPLYLSAKKICQKLKDHGFVAYFAGGCVRDSFLGLNAHDLDIATSATPDQVMGIFAKTIPVGKAFGVVVVVDENHQFEVATFRKEGGYQDGRHPEVIEFSGAKEDALRRDFTMNGLFYDPFSDQILDFVQGETDIQNKIIRAIGEPQLRFQEDHLRLLRAVRFSAQLDFDIEEKTFIEIQKNAALIKSVSVERIQQEMIKMLRAFRFQKRMDLILQSHLFQNLFPEARWSKTSWPLDLESQFRPNEDEDFWILFWIWYQRSSKQSLVEVEKKIEQMRFSSAQKKCITQALSWVLNSEVFQGLSIGELIAYGFEKGHQKGLQLSLRADEKFQNVWQVLTSLQFQKPEPLVRATDLTDLSGKDLGAALKKLYHLQLEGVVKTKTEGLEFYKNKMRTN